MKYKKKEDLWLNLTSMTDMVFLLLTFFMISVSFTGEASRLKIKLPTSKYVEKPDVQHVKKVVIECAGEDEIAINGKKVAFSGVDNAIKNLADGTGEQIVIVRADKSVKYSLIVKILGIAKSYNLSKISMEAVQED